MSSHIKIAGMCLDMAGFEVASSTPKSHHVILSAWAEPKEKNDSQVPCFLALNRVAQTLQSKLRAFRFPRACACPTMSGTDIAYATSRL